MFLRKLVEAYMKTRKKVCYFSTKGWHRTWRKQHEKGSIIPVVDLDIEVKLLVELMLFLL